MNDGANRSVKKIPFGNRLFFLTSIWLPDILGGYNRVVTLAFCQKAVNSHRGTNFGTGYLSDYYWARA